MEVSGPGVGWNGLDSISIAARVLVFLGGSLGGTRLGAIWTDVDAIWTSTSTTGNGIKLWSFKSPV
ncbi:hypothetical protein AMTR_s00112p00071900 [Amborella trichopoda]|uniref:Uncharacterized protein n=1 Tax=Amborella trichopoda TaxID=13333 RepID=W1NXN9_AMBTC|nr:hypothetical protein AMTR_s00112p00071900 [Amborella trichopoda]